MTRFARHIGIFIAALFLLLQGVATAHASAYGDQHDHDGVACSVTVMAEDEAVAPAPVLTVVPVEIEITPVVLRPLRTQTFATQHAARAPPPRGPPA